METPGGGPRERDNSAFFPKKGLPLEVLGAPKNPGGFKTIVILGPF